MLDERFATIPVRLVGDRHPTPIEVWGHFGAEAPRTLVAIHGYGDNHYTWQGLRDELDGRVGRFLSFDLPGHGRSCLPPAFAANWSLNACELTREIVRRHGREPVILAGNSLGGIVAIGAAILESEYHTGDPIAGLLLTSPATLSTREPPFMRLVDLRAYRLAAALTRRAAFLRTALVRVVAALAFRTILPLATRPDPRWARSVRASLLRPGAWLDLETVARELRAVLRGEREQATRLFDRLGELELPVHILRGRCDRVIGDAELRELANRLPMARYEQLEGVGHCAHAEAPGLTARALLELMGGGP